MSGTRLPLGLLSAFFLFSSAGLANATPAPAPDQRNTSNVVSATRALRPAAFAQPDSLARRIAMGPAEATSARMTAAKAGNPATDIWLKGLVAAMLVAYQLRRKHRVLRVRPFSR
ncbi:MAG TPA: hypothetical protein VE046_07350 [Steroidobacteraceae bacterium]|nr:hypothetical protein [Steroidobacteraceae bacterium]